LQLKPEKRLATPDIPPTPSIHAGAQTNQKSIDTKIESSNQEIGNNINLNSNESNSISASFKRKGRGKKSAYKKRGRPARQDNTKQVPSVRTKKLNLVLIKMINGFRQYVKFPSNAFITV